MRQKSKNKIILLTLGIFFVLLTTTSINNPINSDTQTIESDHPDRTIKLSAPHAPIHIDNNWTDAKAAGIATGSGTYADPYVIEDYIIDGGNLSSCILIENSNVYFKIENCTVYNSASGKNGSYDAGIKLGHVNNGQLINNNCSNNDRYGIYIYMSNNNTVSGNTASYNQWDGIYIYMSNNITVSGNTASYNNIGIHIHFSNKNTVSGNTVKYNSRGINMYLSNNNTVSGNIASYNHYGIFIDQSNYNTISGNIISYMPNWYCIDETECVGNIIENNTCEEYKEEPPPDISGYNICFLIGVIGIISVILVKKRLK